MSYDGNEPLSDVMETLRKTLPSLTRLLHSGKEVETLHPTVEMVSVLLIRYDRGEIVEAPGDGGLSTIPPRRSKKIGR